jgi:hypothetical protein
MRLIILCVAFIALAGCSVRIETAAQKEEALKRRRAVADSAATIWEIADALEKITGVSNALAPIDKQVKVIKANAVAIIRSQGHKYPPAGLNEVK